jgi:hypothetical protein
LSKNTAKVGDVISLEMIVKGTGNLHTISKPKLNLPEGFSLYGDPEIKEDLDYTDDGVSGFKSYLFHLKVTKGGKIELPNLSISYFDPSLKKYVTVNGKSETIDVEGTGDEAKIQVVDSSGSQQGEEVLVKPTLKIEENQKSVPNANKWIVFLLFIIGILGGLLFINYLKKSKKKPVQAEESKHVEPMVAYEKKTVPSTSFIEDAETFALRGDYHAAYSLIHKHLPKYVITQLNFQDPDFSSKSLVDVMEQHTIPQNSIDDYQNIIKTCEEVIYGYADKSIEFQDFIQKVKSLIKIL